LFGGYGIILYIFAVIRKTSVMRKFISQADYELSNKAVLLKSVRLESGKSSMVLDSGESVKERGLKSTALVHYLCDKYGIPYVSVCVSDSKRKKQGNGEVRGLYYPAERKIVVYNKTAAKGNVIAIKTFYDTLLHEFMHHYDHCILRLHDSPHTKGFYLRIRKLKAKLG
jgi:surface antigen